MIRTQAVIQKVKRKMNRNIPSFAVKLAAELNLSEATVRRILNEDLKLISYKMTVQSSLPNQHKKNRKKFANGIRTNFRKDNTMKILFTDKKMFDTDVVHNSQNQGIWAANHEEADAQGSTKGQRKFPQQSNGLARSLFTRCFSSDHLRGR